MSLDKKIYVRIATVSDAKYILEIIRESFVDYCNIIGIDTVEALEEKENDILNDIIEKSVYVACLDGFIIGSVRVEMKGLLAYISRFATLPEYQSLGVGGELLSYVENDLLSLGIRIFELYSAVENIRLKEFYISKGYSVVSVDESKGYIRGLFRKEVVDKK